MKLETARIELKMVTQQAELQAQIKEATFHLSRSATECNERMCQMATHQEKLAHVLNTRIDGVQGVAHSNTERLEQVTGRLEQVIKSSKKMQIQLDALQRNQSINQTGIIEGRNLFGDSSNACKYMCVLNPQQS
jgi:hypothetical protein